jgi:cytochrome P450
MDAVEIFTALGTPDGRANPYPHYAALHELGEVINLGPGAVAVVGYDAINSVLRDTGFRVSDDATFEHDFPRWRDNPVFVQAMDWILNPNAPQHSRIRSLMARAFTARRVAGPEPAIARMADNLLDAMAERGAGFPKLTGRVSGQSLATWRVSSSCMTPPLPAINAAAVELLAYFTGLAVERRAHPRDDLVTDLLAISDSDESRVGYATQVGGVAVDEGDSVMTLLGAGNQDPGKFTDPDKLDPLRGDGSPLSFGGGAHFSIGAALARLEGTVAFPRVLTRFPKIAAAGEPVRRETFLLRGFDALPVTVA